MMYLREPSDDAVRRFLDRERALPFSYPHAGATAAEGAPPGYVLDHNRTKLGDGDRVFAAACEALRGWKQFPAPWTRIVPFDAPITQGTVVAVVARVYGAWWLSSARIVYTIDEPSRFGFAYGTLPGHVEMGEERFLVERSGDGGVWYDLRAFSRPRHPLARLMYPLTRRLQKRFARESLAAMLRCW